MKRSTKLHPGAMLAATGLAMAVALVGCKGKGKATPPAPEVPAEKPVAAVARHDREVAVRVCKEVGAILRVAPDSIKPTDAFARDLGADSLDLVEIVMAVEENFNIAIADADAVKLTTVGDLIDLVQAKLGPGVSKRTLPCYPARKTSLCGL